MIFICRLLQFRLEILLRKPVPASTGCGRMQTAMPCLVGSDAYPSSPPSKMPRLLPGQGVSPPRGDHGLGRGSRSTTLPPRPSAAPPLPNDAAPWFTAAPSPEVTAAAPVAKAIPPPPPKAAVAASLLLRRSSAERCPGLPADSGLPWCLAQRVSTYVANVGYQHLDLRQVFPPMRCLTRVPAAVVTKDADRYFFIQGGPCEKWTDSRLFRGLKLPAEKQAIGYATAELWPNIGAATTDPETRRRLLVREVSAATTLLDSPSGSDSEAMGSDSTSVSSADPRWGPWVWSHTGVEWPWAGAATQRPREFHRLLRQWLLAAWAEASKESYVPLDGGRTLAWWKAAGVHGLPPPLQPPWREMVAAAFLPGGLRLPDACHFFAWHVSLRFRLRKMMAAWAAVASESNFFDTDRDDDGEIMGSESESSTWGAYIRGRKLAPGFPLRSWAEDFLQQKRQEDEAT